MAAGAATAQAATGGRFHLGLALGAKIFVEGPFGVPYERPAARLREFLQALRPVLETGRTDFRGELVTAVTPPGLSAALPGAEPTIPVLVAAMGPQALRATAELADGILPYLAGPRVLENRIVPTLLDTARIAGRPAPRIVAFVAAVITDNPDDVRASAAAQMGFYDAVPSYARVIAEEGADHAADLALIGDEETVAAGIAATATRAPPRSCSPRPTSADPTPGSGPGSSPARSPRRDHPGSTTPQRPARPPGIRRVLTPGATGARGERINRYGTDPPPPRRPVSPGHRAGLLSASPPPAARPPPGRHPCPSPRRFRSPAALWSTSSWSGRG